MTAFASSTPNDRARPPSLRLLDDAALGQQIASALRSGNAGDGAALVDGYRLEGEPEIDAGIARFDATREVDGATVLIEMLDKDAASDAARVEAFAFVALAQLELRHRCVTAVLEVGTSSDGRPFRVCEALDTEPLLQLLAREGVLPWKRARNIVLQLCAGLSAARAHGLRPRELSLRACRRARHSLGADQLKLGELVRIEPHEPSYLEVRALAKIIEQLTGLDGAPARLNLVGAPPAELGELLARAHSNDPQQRFRDATALGRAIAAIGQGVTSWSRARSSATAGIIVDRNPVQTPVGPMVVACSRADAPAVPTDRADAPLPRVIVSGAVAPPRHPHRHVGPLGAALAIVVTLGAASLMSPQIRARASAAAHVAADAIGRGFRGLQPPDLAAERQGVAMAAIAPAIEPEPKPAIEPPPPAPPAAPPVVAPPPVVTAPPPTVVAQPQPRWFVVPPPPAEQPVKPVHRRAKKRAAPHREPIASAAVTETVEAPADMPAAEPAPSDEPTSPPEPAPVEHTLDRADSVPVPEP